MKVLRHVVAFLAGAAFLLSASGLHAHDVRIMTVHIDEEGFSPKEVDILQGDTVIFENSGKDLHWPASDIHPTHGIYPEFDTLKGLKPGEKWNMRFDRAGRWTFHDHLVPEFLGVVRVQADKHASPSGPDFLQSLKATLRDVADRIVASVTRIRFAISPSARAETLKEINAMHMTDNERDLTHWIRVFGPTVLMDDLLADNAAQGEPNCHTQAHKIGRSAFAIEGAKAFEGGSSACHSGYYHGAMEMLLQKEGTDHLTTTVTELCKKFPTSFTSFECFHGIGHGLLAYENYDLPATLELCRTLETGNARSGCMGGAFMENVVTGQGNGAAADHKTPWVSSDPHFPCNAVSQDEEVQHQCYQMQTSWMLTISRRDYPTVVAECLKAPKELIHVCYRSLGRDAAGDTIRNPEGIIRLCNLVTGEDRYREECIVGGLHVIVDFWGPDLASQAVELCRKVEDKLKPACYKALSWRITDVFNDPRTQKRLCNDFEPEYRSLCSKQ